VGGLLLRAVRDGQRYFDKKVIFMVDEKQNIPVLRVIKKEGQTGEYFFPLDDENPITDLVVAQLFRKASKKKRRPQPSMETCRQIAVKLQTERGLGKLEEIGREESTAEMRTYGKQFLKSLRDGRLKFEQYLSNRQGSNHQSDYGNDLASMDLSVSNFLETIEGFGPPDIKRFEYRIETIARLARDAWAEVVEPPKKPPKAIDPGSLIVTFVVNALKAIGDPRKAESVSYVLRKCGKNF
jgi:hypothetical protein